jgi:hypothetical protein
VPNGKPASMKWTLISMLNPKTIRKMGSEAIAAATGAPDECEGWRWSAGYAARPVRGDPRGRKSGPSLEATNPR